jgi:hypothetical protein
VKRAVAANYEKNDHCETEGVYCVFFHSGPSTCQNELVFRSLGQQTTLKNSALSQNSVFLANGRWPVEVRVRVCVKLASAMQPIKLVPGKWLGKGNHR